jgi:hypothetical protein
MKVGNEDAARKVRGREFEEDVPWLELFDIDDR